MEQVYLVFEFQRSTMRIDVQVYKTSALAQKYVHARLAQLSAGTEAKVDEANQEWHLADGSYLSIQQKPVQD